MLDKYVHQDLLFDEQDKVTKLQATIADLQGLVEANRITRDRVCDDLRAAWRREAALQQRVAQLEGENEKLNARRKEWKVSDKELHDPEYMAGYVEDFGATVDAFVEQQKALQASHATLVGLVEALPVYNGVIGVKETEMDQAVLWGVTEDGYFTARSPLFDTEEEAKSYAELLAYRAAQPADGGE